SPGAPPPRATPSPARSPALGGATRGKGEPASTGDRRRREALAAPAKCATDFRPTTLAERVRKIILQDCGDGCQYPLHLRQIMPFRIRRHRGWHAAHEEVYPEQIPEFDAHGIAKIVANLIPLQAIRQCVLPGRQPERDSGTHAG
ncbi:MAG: hypothetical protein WCI75_13610, partial [candidate division NC10 bacterium]